MTTVLNPTVGRGRRSQLLARCCLLASAIGLVLENAGVVHDQTAATNKMDTSKLQFRLPFSLPDSERAKLREVQLYVKTATEPWVCKETVSAQQASFSYRAAQDGDYWFGI